MRLALVLIVLGGCEATADGPSQILALYADEPPSGWCPEYAAWPVTDLGAPATCDSSGGAYWCLAPPEALGHFAEASLRFGGDVATIHLEDGPAEQFCGYYTVAIEPYSGPAFDSIWLWAADEP